MTGVQFTIGERVTCSDGACGTLRRVVVDPVASAITHLVVEHWHEEMRARLVPVELADASGGEIKLRCSRAEFEQLPPAEERNFVADKGYPGYDPIHVLTLPYSALGGGYAAIADGILADREELAAGAGGHGDRRPTYTYDSVPAGEVQVRRGEQVHATDGEIGVVEGLVIDPANHHVTHVLLKEGHLWGSKEVAIPIGAVTDVRIGIRLNMSKQQVADLPPVDIDRLD
jgi:sporulation protein YlmC with PRC-barrel domain